MGVLSNDHSNSADLILPDGKFEDHKDRRELKHAELRKLLSNGSSEHRGQIIATRKNALSVNDWNFDVFAFSALTEGRSLFHISLHLFYEYNFIETFKLDVSKLMKFISLVEEGYHSSNPYHNAVHAADVTQAMHCYLRERKMDKALSPLEKMTAIVSAMTHDLDHPGVNQAFLIASSNHLATLYNNCSVLENHHWRSAVALLRQSEVFDHLESSVWEEIESQLKSLILATDISRQNDFLRQFREYLSEDSLNLDDPKHRDFILQIALKCADVSNPGRPWRISKQWSELVCEEFFNQGDCERKMCLPVTPCCDRQTTCIEKVQIGFMNYVVMPLFKEWHSYHRSPLSQTILSNIKLNMENWEDILLQSKFDKVEQEPETKTEE